MHVEYEKKEKKLTLKIEEEIDHCSAEKLRKRMDYEIEIHIPRQVVFDLEKVTFMDSSGIGMLIGRYKLASMLGGKVSIKNVKPAIKKVLEMSGVLKLIQIEENKNIGGTSFEKCI